VYTDETDTVIRFKIGQHGELYASQGNFQVDSSGNMTTNRTLGAANAVSGTALFSVDSGGNVSATSYSTTSSRALKQDIAALSAECAAELLDGLEPVRFRYKHDAEHEHLGFILEDTPPALAPTGHGVSIMDLIAVLTRVAKEQQKEIEQEQKRQLELRHRLEAIQSSRSGDASRGNAAP